MADQRAYPSTFESVRLCSEAKILYASRPDVKKPLKSGNVSHNRHSRKGLITSKTYEIK